MFKFKKINEFHPFLKYHFKGERILHFWSIYYEVYYHSEYIGDVLESDKNSFLGKGWHLIKDNKVINTNYTSRKKACLSLLTDFGE